MALPPGRLRLVTRPSKIGSTPLPKTIGMVDVAAFAASAVGLPNATNTDAFRATSSAASAGSRDSCPSAYRYSIATFRPTEKPDFSNVSKNGTRTGASASTDRVLK